MRHCLEIFRSLALKCVYFGVFWQLKTTLLVAVLSSSSVDNNKSGEFIHVSGTFHIDGRMSDRGGSNHLVIVASCWFIHALPVYTCSHSSLYGSMAE